jgi:hypothetical protein
MTASPSTRGSASSSIMRSPLRAMNASSMGNTSAVLQSPPKKQRMDQFSGVSKSPSSLHHASVVAQFDPFSPSRIIPSHTRMV